MTKQSKLVIAGSLLIVVIFALAKVFLVRVVVFEKTSDMAPLGGVLVMIAPEQISGCSEFNSVFEKMYPEYSSAEMLKSLEADRNIGKHLALMEDSTRSKDALFLDLQRRAIFVLPVTKTTLIGCLN